VCRAFDSHLGRASSRVAAGSGLTADVLDMEVRLAQAREDLVRARNANALSERALRNLLGLEAPEEFTVAENPPAASAPEDNDFSRRPELIAISERERATEARVRQARAGYRPQLSAFGSLDYDHGWRTDGDGRSYTVGVTVQWD